jgi:hypothetical protein
LQAPIQVLLALDNSIRCANFCRWAILLDAPFQMFLLIANSAGVNFNLSTPIACAEYSADVFYSYSAHPS